MELFHRGILGIFLAFVMIASAQSHLKAQFLYSHKYLKKYKQIFFRK